MLAAWLVAIGSSLPWAAWAAPQTGSSLQVLIAEVLARHPQLAVQGASLRAAEAGVEGARWQFYPTPSLSVENAAVSAGDSSYTGDKQVTILGLRQSLWNAGRLSANLDRARATVLLNSALLAESRLQLVMRVIQAYGEWAAAHDKQKIYATGLVLHQQMKDMVVRRVQEGQSAPSDQILAEERLAMLEADALASGTQKQTAMLKLTQLAGRPVLEPELAQRAATAHPLAHTLEQLLRQAQDSSPTLARYRAIAQSQASLVAERQADQWPEVYARLERQFGNYSAPGRAPVTRAFIGLSTRFGAGLSTQSSIAEARGQQDAALAEIEVQRLGLQEQVMVDHTVLVQSDARRLALQQGAAKSQLVQQSWDRQFLSGRKTWQDLMNSAREHIQLETQMADLEATRLVAFWRLLAVTDYEHLLTPP
ncbi:conserved exported hypothetical protein [Rubrivivax sp. A210]|uniref:TolC family protein n=1 Tax=Rubrivivax sp. A210 TaxID=2772301 RepID=UPI0019A258AD|nr:TolC family protein [Rubrivivax sp. A210]CAD5371035.1 conserved exported hypothetical protein [Rubrivivax sp. A210]